jgi:hypothetical protein
MQAVVSGFSSLLRVSEVVTRLFGSYDLMRLPFNGWRLLLEK